MEPEAESGLTPAEARLLRALAVDLVKRYEREGDILNWGQILFPHKFPLPFCLDMHGYFVEIQDEELSDTEAPRGRAKTTIKCFLIPLFKALTQPQKYRHYLNVQSTEDKALAVNRSLKHELENNELLREVYGDQVGRERWTDGQFVLPSGVIFTAIGAGQSIRGINFNNIRPDYIIVDDLYDLADIENPVATEQKNKWFWSDLYPARAQDRFSSVHVQGTAINKSDLLEELKGKPGVKYKSFRTVIDWDKKIVLWPELKNFDAVMAEKAKMPSVVWYREYQNERRDEANAIVKRAWIKEYDPAELWKKLDKHYSITAVKLGVDPSIGKKLENDFTGIALVLEARHNDGDGCDYYIEAVWNEQISLNDRVLLLQQIRDSRPPLYPLSRVRIESIAGFKDFTSEVIRRTNLPVDEVDKVPDKIANLVNKSHFFENGKVYVNKFIEAELKEELIYQLTTNHPRHDDVRDAVLLCLEDGGGVWNFV